MFPTFRRASSSHGLKHKAKFEINRVRVSKEERKSGQLSRHNIRRSLDEFHRNGLVILEDAVGHHSLEHIHHKMQQDFAKCCEFSHFRWNQGQNSGNISQPLPPLPEYLHEEVWANRLGVDIMKNIIGPRPQLSFATSNIALPKSMGRQAVHSDYYCPHHDFPVFLEVNVYLQDVDSRNGATEFWLGTHKGYSKDDHSSPTTGWIKQEIFKTRAEVSPPIQPAISKGSLLIRDLRCWHAGRENHSSEPRIVLGFLFSPHWFGSHMRMLFPYSARMCIESWTHIDCLETSEFVANDFDYLGKHQDLNLTQTSIALNTSYIRKHATVEVTPRDYWLSS